MVGKVSIPLGQSQKVTQICAGDSISACLTNDGRVYTWGTFRDSQGVMGHGSDTDIQEQPRLLSQLAHLKVGAITAGANHLVALTLDDRHIYTWGCGEQGQLGRRVLSRHKLLGLRPTNVTPRVPHKRRALQSIARVVCGSYHTVAIAEAEAGEASGPSQGNNANGGLVYAMGLNNYGQLGLGDHEPRSNAELIEPPSWNGERIINAGAGEHHSLALSAEGHVFAFGRNDFGQLGLAHSVLQGCRVANIPKMIESLTSISMIAVGGNHSLALNAQAKRVYSWGYGEMGQLGHGVEQDEIEPKIIERLVLGPHEQVIGLAAGGQHSIILTVNEQ